jgi:NAD(P)-dependent dehydrogenase (short-subunit alcohol dehydrogenase family)
MEIRMPQPDLTGRVILVTGANSGIGKVTAEELAKMGATLVMVSRDRERGATALAEVRTASGNQDVHLLLGDLSVQAEIVALADQFKAQFDRLDVLVNNAGVFLNNREESADGLEMTFAVNHLAYFLLTQLLLDMLKASSPARIVNVSSGAHQGSSLNFDDLQHEQSYSGFQVYRRSKLMNILFTYALDRRLTGSGVTVNVIHPGFTRTNFGRRDNGLMGKLAMPFMALMGRSAEKGAETVIYLASAPEVADVSGKYFVDKQAVKSSPESYDEDIQERLWQVSAGLVKPVYLP